MTRSQAEAIRARACGEKVAMGRNAAEEVVGKARKRGTRLVLYRCPFRRVDVEGIHFHIGHSLSVVGMQDMADAIRVLAQGCDLRPHVPVGASAGMSIAHDDTVEA